MYCPKCGTEMRLVEKRQDVWKFLGATGCIGCLLFPVAIVLMPLAFFLPKKKYHMCPSCNTELPA